MTDDVLMELRTRSTASAHMEAAGRAYQAWAAIAGSVPSLMPRVMTSTKGVRVKVRGATEGAGKLGQANADLTLLPPDPFECDWPADFDRVRDGLERALRALRRLEPVDWRALAEAVQVERDRAIRAMLNDDEPEHGDPDWMPAADARRLLERETGIHIPPNTMSYNRDKFPSLDVATGRTKYKVQYSGFKAWATLRAKHMQASRKR